VSSAAKQAEPQEDDGSRATISPVKALKARVSKGRLILDVATSLPEGTELEVVLVEPGEHERFVAAIQEGLADSDAGRLLDDAELGRELDAQLGASPHR
jgi:hypothetical protein